MGFFDFIKDAGSKIFGGEAKAATADDLKKEVASNGFDANKLEIKVDGDKVVVTGQAKSQEEAEKIILSLGNTIGVAQVNTDGLQVEKPAPESKMYTVKKGDTLWKIAEEHYGKGKGAKYTEIVKANTPPVKNPDLIQPGWVLRIPPLA
ncbi:LysM domain/BON superfamily protein [Variibacter gotjawalensis]|uniref:LysM domain/BON superfamily protein n=1 Tax=Variibacter gotjawalensis TaxID=1333996 RepID=A0A0S3PP61_9BRAD|nr:peptidoglycan-binding protein LysM [Variibacter gotjawalensis]NIK47953.1 nucleoid-associated protein YgaU [Variibacter gotjawalensis]RZS49831.1 BON domain-containing protein [Variibacter gotjawalensis]BAT57660.1 LysM domain/BON superfamily protein [Variibacter gotjawalensis]